MGIHRERLAASKAHRRFIEGARTVVQTIRLCVPDASEISPTMIGAQPLPFAAPPMMEDAQRSRSRHGSLSGFLPRTLKRAIGHQPQ
jgi:hypothetical protein